VTCDFDWLVIGSGFGGSVSALRLAQKGHRVGVLECGRRFADDELPKSTWDLRRYWYVPRLGLKGIFRLTIFRDVAIASELVRTSSPSRGAKIGRAAWRVRGAIWV
jgi:cholesterol oxidase